MQINSNLAIRSILIGNQLIGNPFQDLRLWDTGFAPINDNGFANKRHSSDHLSVNAFRWEWLLAHHVSSIEEAPKRYACRLKSPPGDFLYCKRTDGRTHGDREHAGGPRLAHAPRPRAHRKNLWRSGTGSALPLTPIFAKYTITSVNESVATADPVILLFVRGREQNNKITKFVVLLPRNNKITNNKICYLMDQILMDQNNKITNPFASK